MKYGLMRFSDDLDERKDKPAREIILEKCCAKCYHFIEVEDKYNYYGLCCKHSDSEWDLFCWADDCCQLFKKDI